MRAQLRGPSSPSRLAQLYPERAARTRRARIGVSGIGFQVQYFGDSSCGSTKSFLAPPTARSTLRRELDGFLDELCIKWNRYAQHVRTRHAVAGVEGAPPAARRGSAGAGVPSPSRGATAPSFTLPSRTRVTLRVIDAGPRCARSSRACWSPASIARVGRLRRHGTASFPASTGSTWTPAVNTRPKVVQSALMAAARSPRRATFPHAEGRAPRHLVRDVAV